MAQKDTKENHDKKVEEKTIAREETQVTLEVKLEEVHLSMDP